ncbi:hypothetical protein BC941DRAFT_475277 [Chlamydoabsidia padenii]|nr:hypothetical protein BC941DRAFT_475277 [Chlamydoabsidia padenii]
MYSRLRSNPYASSALKALVWFPVIIFIADHGFSYATVEGRSIQPTFNPDSNLLRRDVVLFNQWAATSHEFKHGEVVPIGLVHAKVTRILWPPSRCGKAVEIRPLSPRVEIGYIKPGQDDDYWD